VEIQAHLRDLDIRLFPFADDELEHRKQVDNILFYDDLLLRVRNGLAAEDGLLAQAVRSRFKAALVDEFQDTDSIQCEIFLHLFASTSGLLFMIGDPKQSIYSFRGSDIFSYLKAARQARRTYTLRRNWRSTPGLIRAVNTLFAHVPQPFVYREIGFETGSPGPEPIPEEPAGPALDLWYFRGNGGRPLNKSDAVQRISAAVADEILRLATDPDGVYHPGEIAILVRSNRQGRRMKAALDARGIPAVLYGAGNVFDSPEAAELQRLLTGICEHSREECFRSALVTELLGLTAEQIDGAEADAKAWEDRRARFREYADLWQRNGFMPMFRRLLAREQVMERLLGLVDGERRLTNLFHLAELLQEESLRRPPSMVALIRWLTDQRSADAPRREEQLLRLESDARAVNILTIHRSKGLEFPVVFCPFTWEGSQLRSEAEVVCHDPDSANRILDLGSDQIEEHRQRARAETLAENLRLFYVAVTRAQSHCYLVWGRFNTADTSAPAYLFHRPPQTAGDADIVAALQNHLTGLDSEQRLRDLQQLAARSDGSIALTVRPEESPPAHRAPEESRGPLQCRNFTGWIDRSWKVTSYTALTSRKGVEEDRPQHDSPARESAPAETRKSEKQAAGSAERRIEHFPKGARAGIFFHDLLQRIPFDRPVAADVVLAKLQEYNFDSEWQSCVTDALDRLLEIELLPGVQMRSVPQQQRVHEMEFTVPLQPLSPRDLQAIFDDIDLEVPNPYAVQMDALEFSPVRGFLKGYIDLVFEHGNRYYLVDWKSNHLGDERRFYRPGHLAEVMTAERYGLQYLLYTVALDRYLRSRRSDYRYRRHFGGVFYLFLRGISADVTDRSGIFYDRPDPQIIDALGKALIGTR